MKLLLTAESIHNKTIANALRSLLGKPSKECSLVYISTSQNAAKGNKTWFVENLNDAFNIGWKSFEIIDVAAMIDLPKNMWWGRLESADVIFMGGGANFYLGYWLEKSGIAAALPRWLETKVYIGSSAGSMILTPSLVTASKPMEQLANDDEIDMKSMGPEGQRSASALGIVDFLIRPHYTSPNYPYITDGVLQKAANLGGRSLYAIDNDTAIAIDGDVVKVISEGQWKKFEANS